MGAPGAYQLQKWCTGKVIFSIQYPFSAFQHTHRDTQKMKIVLFTVAATGNAVNLSEKLENFDFSECIAEVT